MQSLSSYQTIFHRAKTNNFTICMEIKKPKDSTRKLLELISEYSKVARYEINTQKSLAFLYTNNEKIDREIKETIPYTTVTKRISKTLTMCR